jgi:hypothetical protein
MTSRSVDDVCGARGAASSESDRRLLRITHQECQHDFRRLPFDVARFGGKE